MKNWIACLLAFLLCIQVAPVFANPGFDTNSTLLSFRGDVRVNSEDVSGRVAGLEINGQIPVVSGLSNGVFQRRLNDSIMSIFNTRRIAAQRESARGITFAFDWVSAVYGDYQDMISIRMTVSSATASGREEVYTFNFDPYENRMLNLTDILGPNAVPLANRFILETIRQNPESYNLGFRGISEDHAFSVEDGICTIWFDKYAIAPGHRGVRSFDIVLDDVRHVVLQADEYTIARHPYNLKMIPLRDVAQRLGYTIDPPTRWDDRARTVTIVKNGGFRTTITIGQNRYMTAARTWRELEAAPELEAGRTFVPISFFEIILGAFYTVDHEGTIVFSQYQ